MAAFSRNLKYISWAMIVIVIILLAGFVYATFFRPAYAVNNSMMNAVVMIAIGLGLGGLIAFLIYRLTLPRKQATVTESSHTIVESMRKVFKIVCAEGHFNELYNFEETKKLFGFIPSTKRALVIINAKVLVGYDFNKFRWEADEESQRIKLLSFPEPEILSIETDYKYYNFEENLFNLLGREDLTRIQQNGKKQVEIAALKSHLPRIASEQMRTMLTEVVQGKNWMLEDSYKIADNENPALKDIPPVQDQPFQ